MQRSKPQIPTAVAALVAALVAASSAEAQQAATATADQLAEVVVTGSRIKGASDSGAIAVSVLNAEQLEAFGKASTGEILENLAQAGTFEINAAADGPNDARGDIATVNLRGLGTGNTLVLLNGRRIAAHAVNQDIGSTPRQVTNVNAFPSAGIDRVEVLRDGASALYGADATAGVVNTILDAEFSRPVLTARFSELEGTGSRERSVDFSAGTSFNGDRSRIKLSASAYDRSGLYSSELGLQFQFVDKRAFLGASPFATGTPDFRNTSTASPFGQYQVGSLNAQNVWVGQRVRVGTTSVTSSTGVFHIQPCGFTGTLAQLGTRPGGCMGIDDGSLDAGLRYDFNVNQPNNSLNEGVNIINDALTARGRQMISDAQRYNAYLIGEHDISDDLQAFGEVLYYRATTDSNRAAQPADSGLAFLVIPKTNYWNPFGPTGSPNRLPGLSTTDVPAAGRDVLVSNWRPTELGPRLIATETETYRVIAGLRGERNGWDWEGAVGASANETTDSEGNRISKTLLQQQLALSTPDAINPFGGPNANSTTQWDKVRISSTNTGATALYTADLRTSNSAAFSNWAGDIGVAAGLEWRHENYKEDRDPRLDGTIIFSTANVSGISDVVGVSPTRDSSANRNVYSAFAEALVPLHRGEGTWVNDLTLQLAVRGEYFDDINAEAVKPKVALSWFPVRGVNLRAAYSQGFRAPNLVQLNRGDVSRLNLGTEDFWRSDVTRDPLATGATYAASLRQSNPDLKNEDTETLVAGVIVDLTRMMEFDAVRDLRFSVDYWRFEQKNVIGAFGDEEALALDFLLRKQGSSNPNVVRSAPTADDLAAFAAWNAANPGDQRTAAGSVQYVIDPYINLDKQVADGIDLGFAVGVDVGAAGKFDLDLEATYLNTLDVFRNDLLSAIAANPNFAGSFDSLAVDRVRLDGNPRWRGAATLGWRKGRMGAGASLRYVGDFQDTGADVDVDGDGVAEFWQADAETKVNVYGDYRFGEMGPLDGLRLRLGVNNVFDKAPPLVDESLGYSPQYHSLKGREYYLQIRASF
jgi:outer membrane receptor protein involved in Fe transport